MNKLLFPLAVAFIVAGLAGGFMAVGGPQFARMEKNDQQRVRDLRSLARYYRCQPDVTDADTTAQAGCANQTVKPAVADPVTGAAYEFALVDQDTFEVCANFETDTERQRIAKTMRPNGMVFDGQRGCARYMRSGIDGAFAPMQQFEITPKP